MKKETGINKDCFHNIEILTKLLIELNFKEKEIGQSIYVKKKDCYQDLIKFIKEYYEKRNQN